MKFKISAFIITKNEEKNIEDCLKSLSWVNEIVVVDDFSEDSTEAICKNYNVKFIKNKFISFKEQKSFAMSNTSNEWVLEIDADERASDEMKKEIENLIDDDLKKYDGFEFKRKNYLRGKWLKFGAQYPDYKLRLYNKKRGNWSENKVHERFIVNGASKRLKGDILHFQDVDLKKLISKTINYSFLSAQELFKKGKKAKWHHYTIRPLYTFFYRYFFRLGFLDGLEGFIISVVGAIGTFSKYMFLKEMERNNNGKK